MAVEKSNALQIDPLVHPVAELFPMLSEPEIHALAESLRQEGLINPCVRQNGVLRHSFVASERMRPEQEALPWEQSA